MKKFIIPILVSCSLSGCATRIADLTVGSTHNINLNSSQMAVGQTVEGSDMVPVVLFPFGIPNIESAIDEAINQDQCAVGLTNIVIERLDQSFLVGRYGYRVKGNLLYDTNKIGCEHAHENNQAQLMTQSS
jgi:hypothetical protein